MPCLRNLREYQQKTFATLNRFWQLGRGGEGLSEYIKTKFDKNLFSYNVEQNFKKLLKITSADVKTNSLRQKFL